MPTLRKRKSSADAALAAIERLPGKPEIAQRYGVTTRTVDTWVAQRLVPFIKLGHRTIRFRWPDVERAIARLTIKEKP